MSCWHGGEAKENVNIPQLGNGKSPESSDRRWTTEIAATITDCKGVGNGRKTVIQKGWVSKI